MREWDPIRSIPYHLPWVLGLAVVMVVTGPFGSYDRMRLDVRLVYFSVIGVLTWVQVLGCIAALRQVKSTHRWRIPVRMAVACLLAALPSTAEIVVLHGWLVAPIPWRAFLYIYPQTAFIAVIISILIGLSVERRLHAGADAERTRVAANPSQAGPSIEPVPPTDFFRRVPPALGRDLLALEMEDHYLRIHTAIGSDLILLRLRDALAELGPVRGRQVHRSWWVAEGAIATVERDPRRPILILRNGLRVPVSKSFRDQVKEAGWLA